jgi:N4-bis(aminopropyl)spermidine synthase
MDDLIDDVYKNITIQEGKSVIEKFIIEVYFYEGISAKEMSRKLYLPIPLVAAIKNELKKRNIIKVQSGIRLTEEGLEFVNTNLGYKNLNIELYNQLIENEEPEFLQNELNIIDKLLEGRPQVNVTIDQSKCTSTTSLKRAILALKNKSLIGKNILCIGDDDLISVSIGILLKKLYNNCDTSKTTVTVLDIDTRILDYIDDIAKQHDLAIKCINIDLKKALPKQLINCFDCAFTDPPYTLQGLELFVSRALSGLKYESNLKLFLSFGHKNPLVSLDMQKFFWQSGLEICNIYNNYNFYEGAEIIGNTSDMIVLNTTSKTIPLILEDFEELIYTGEIKKTLRIYECMNCKKNIEVSIKSEIKTIEKLKEVGCIGCGKIKFNLKEKLNLT